MLQLILDLIASNSYAVADRNTKIGSCFDMAHMLSKWFVQMTINIFQPVTIFLTWLDFNHVMDRDGQVLIQTKGKTWITTGIKMTRAQIKRQIEQQISEIEKERASELRCSIEDILPKHIFI
jgi:hypothetical protein